MKTTKIMLALVAGLSIGAMTPLATSNFMSPVTVQAAKKYSKKTVNKDLKKELKSDAKLGQQGNQDYKYTDYIERLKVQSDSTVRVYVTADVKNMSTADKNSFAGKVQDLASMVLYNNNWLTDKTMKEGTPLEFYVGDNVIGRSKALDNKTYKWYK